MAIESAYLLTDENVMAILRGLDTHVHGLTIMEPRDVDRIREWQTFCRANPGFCVVYQIDF
jgi:hypothetical protein